jgi:hypothetical protein
MKHKVPHPYSQADENACSLTGIRDDEVWENFQNCTTAQNSWAEHLRESGGLDWSSQRSAVSKPEFMDHYF